MNLDAYQKFNKYIKAFLINIEQGNMDTIIDRTAITGASIPVNKFHNPVEFDKLKTRHILNLTMCDAWLDTATPYEVEDKIVKICSHSKVPRTIKEFLFLPRNPMFIDVEFDNDNFEISDKRVIGILLGERPLTLAGSKSLLQDPLANTHASPDYDIINEVSQVVKNKKLRGDLKDNDLNSMNDLLNTITDGKYKITGKTIGAYLVVENQEGDIFLDSISFNHKLNPEYQKAKMIQTRLPTSKFIENFVLNILNFMNNKEVIFVEHKRTATGNKKRIQQGKMPLPNSQEIRVTGLLKQYIDKASKSGGGWHYNFRFPVSAHKRHYKNGKVIKIEQYEKGIGILINKKRKVVADEKHPDVQRYNEENLDYEDIKPLDEPLRDKRNKGEV